jgi:Na+/H+ antiporter NhaD/arsenite permease-like protein
LIATVIFSNIGGAATAIGDPPNVLIASDIGLIEGGITFVNFTLHMSCCVIIVAIFCGFYLRFALRKISDSSPEERQLHELRWFSVRRFDYKGAYKSHDLLKFN